MKSKTEETYNWRYCQTGGMTRVDILSGEDIAHLDELDEKKWTVLSCPIKGLYFDQETLNIIDSDKDGHIHVSEVIAAAKWLTSGLRNKDVLIYGKSPLAISDFDPDTENGAAAISAADKIFDLIGKENRSEIASEDVAAALAEISKTSFKVLPYGDDSQAASDIVSKMDAKIKDYFVRCSLSAFNAESAGKLDVNPDRISAISDQNLSGCMEEIAKFPLFHISADGTLPISSQINPAWQADFATLKSLVLDKDFPGAESITEAQWNEVVAKIASYEAGKETYDAGDAESIAKLGKFITLTKHFYRFLRNFITFNDFYSRNEEIPAIFQAGRLYIDQRCCDLCIEVTDMAAHNDSATLSGMFLIYCDCKSVSTGAAKTIVAAVTKGDIDNLRKGKNALFYDREGNEWDATITKIIDNPLSIKQAFLSPYKKFINWVSEKINKSASEKESKSFSNLTENAENNINNPSADGKDPKANTKQAFDIAKFAGIFAAIGMAIGYISKALVDIAAGVTNNWYNLPILIALIILVISGPSMLLAWMKLRKRNLAPLLNANGWAVNAAAIINTAFGATLTAEVKYPGIDLVDPIEARRNKAGKRKRTIFIILIIVLAILAILYFNNKLAFMGLPW